MGLNGSCDNIFGLKIVIINSEIPAVHKTHRCRALKMKFCAYVAYILISFIKHPSLLFSHSWIQITIDSFLFHFGHSITAVVWPVGVRQVMAVCAIMSDVPVCSRGSEARGRPPLVTCQLAWRVSGICWEMLTDSLTESRTFLSFSVP